MRNLRTWWLSTQAALLALWSVHKVTILIWLSLLVITLLIFWPFLLKPAFSLVDDGYSLMKGRELIMARSWDDWRSALTESNIGRFRPVYLLSFSGAYLLFGTHPIGLWFSQVIIVWLTLVVLYHVLLFLTKRQWLSLGLSLIWLVLPTVSENIFRVGTAEPKQMLFALMAIWTLLLFHQKQKGKWLGISLLLCGLSIGTKETSVMLLPAYGLVLARPWLERRKPIVILIIVGLLGAVMIGAVLLGLQFVFTSGYAADNFGLDTSQLKLRIFQNRVNFAHYHLLLWIGLISLFLRSIVVIWFKKVSSYIRDNFESLLLVLLTFLSLFFTIAWAFQFERYLYSTWIFIILFLGLEITHWLNLKKEANLPKLNLERQAILIIVGAALLLFGLFVMFDAQGLDYPEYWQKNVDIRQRSFDINQIEQTVIGTLLADQITPVLYTTNDNYEVIYELGLYLSQFRARSVTIISPSRELATDQPGYYYDAQPLTTFLSNTQGPAWLVGRLSDLKGTPLPDGAKVLTPPTQYYKVAEDQAWWVLKKE